MIRITLLGNLTGAVLTFVYFRFLDVSAHEGARHVGQAELLFFVAGFAVLVSVARALRSR